MGYIIHYDIASIMLAVIMLVHFLNRKKIMTPQTNIFLWILWINLFSCILDILMVEIERVKPPVAVGYIGNMLYLISFNTIPAVYLLYLYITIGKRNSFTLPEKILVSVPLTVSYLLILTTPVTKWIFRYDEVSRYTHGKGFVLLYIIAMFYILMAFYLSIRYRHAMTYGQRSSVYFYNLSCIFAILAQISYPDILLLQFVVSISLLLAYLSLEIPKDDEDYTLGIYSRSGFMKRIRTEIAANREFRILGINLVGYQSVREMLGVELSQKLVKQTVETLLPKIRPMYMFVVSPGQFVLFTDIMSLDLNDIIQRIREEFREPVKIAGNEIQLETYLYRLDYPENIQTMEDILDIIDYSLEMAYDNENQDIAHASEEILTKRRNENHIDQILQTAIKENRLEVYYQPIYSVKDHTYHSAEALLRLRDENGTFINPEEFITLAERNGKIIEIGEFVFRSVCSMLADQRLWEKGIDYIEINLSVVQCMQGNLYQRLQEIMKEYGISPQFINLEMTETATVISKDMLWQNMEQLIQQGVTFSLDDYGTGYSNIANVIRYPFYIIKLDKSVIWYAMENERAMRALRHTIAMLKDLDMYIVAEGVETEEQAKQLEDMGCDYFQGFYYSRPVPLDDFLKCINA